jgi:hypothetical protein
MILRKTSVFYLIFTILLVCVTGCKLLFDAQNTEADAVDMKVIIVESSSGPSEIALAKHLKQTGAKLYGSYTCEHCYEQLYLFGKEAARELDRIECEPGGKNANPKLCRDLEIKGYPTWIIDNQRYGGSQSLYFLANKSNYRGPREFLNSLP